MQHKLELTMCRKGYYKYLFPFYICMAFLSFGEGAKVLLAPWPFSSHVSAFMAIGEGLAARGHEVHAISSPTLPSLSKFTKGKVNFILYDAVEPDFYTMYTEEEIIKFNDHVSEITVRTDFRTNVDGFREMCTNLLRDQKLYQRLKGMKFDIAIVDAFPCGRCALVLIHRLGIPYVSMETMDEPWLLRNPALPSAWPTNMADSDKPYTEKMSFWERLDNLWTVIDWAAFTGVSYLEDSFLEEYFYETTPVPLNKLAGDSILWLLEYNLVFDYPRPKMANEIHIGGLTTKPAKHLDDELENFMTTNPEGVVVVSFGSMPGIPSDREMGVLLSAFKQVKYNVIMRYPMTPPSNLPKNIRLQSWLPQNDLLGHKNSKLFITHCGANGQNEALYHGVPMVGIAVFAEQNYNAKRMVYHGFGQSLNFKTFKKEQLIGAINEVISNRSYSENIARASVIFKDQPMKPAETALFWVEHVIKYGGAHMRSHALDMPWYQYLMLDILAFVLLIFMIFVIVMACAIGKLYSILISSNKKPKKD